MFYTIIDERSHAYVTHADKLRVRHTQLLYLARWFNSAEGAVRYLTKAGLGEEFAKRFSIISTGKAQKDLGQPQRGRQQFQRSA